MAETDPRKHTPPPESHPPREALPTVVPPHHDEKRLRKRTVFYISATVIALVILVMAFYQPISAALQYILSILSPLIIGAVIAYLCDPILEFYEYRLFRRMPKGNLRRGLSLILTVLSVIGIVAVICALMIPQLIDSITDLFNDYEVYLNSLLAWVQSGLDKMTENLHVEIVDISDVSKLVSFIADMFGSVENAVSQILNDLQQFVSDGNFLENLWSSMVTLFNTFKNLFFGIFIAFYLLASKEKRVAQFSKFRKAVFKEKTDKRLEEIIVLADKSFGGFIYGRILDSLVICVLTFVMLWIFDVSPYNLLIATFVGITNVIPVFGPFIGAIPSFFIVLISNPDKAFLFLVLIFIIQQLDGNVIGPKILGDNTGVSSLAVLIAIAICSAMWGMVGMLIGVPIFAVGIELVKRFLENRLTAKGEPTDTEHYYPADAVGNAEMDVHYEHSSLLYQYEHSRFKPRFEKMRHNFMSHLGRQSKKDTDPSEDNSDTTTSNTSDTDSET